MAKKNKTPAGKSAAPGLGSAAVAVTGQDGILAPAAPAAADHPWLTGLTAVFVLLLAVVGLHGVDTTWLDPASMAPATQKALWILLATLVGLIAAESLRQRLTGDRLTARAPALNAEFFTTGLLRYLEHLALLWLIQLFYKTAEEYGFARSHPFYLPWHQLFELFFTAYCWVGLPYILLLRAWRSGRHYDERDYGLLLELAFWRLARRVPGLSERRLPAEVSGKAIFLDLLVKLFFLPVFFVFFCDQLGHLFNNLNYLEQGMPKAFVKDVFVLSQWNFDVANCLTSLLFTLHCGLAFCAIAINQRFLPRLNQVYGRLSGWLACLLTFPPFLHMVITSHIPGVTGPHLDGPSPVLAQLPAQGLLTLAIVLMGLSYTLYLGATINLGARFSEVTHRGVVRTGLYARVRHPAYSAKLIGWFCVLAPLIGLNLYDNNWKVAGTLVGAYAVGVMLYVWRALTEEQHLGEDPDYQAYCRQVRWRFIPGII